MVLSTSSEFQSRVRRLARKVARNGLDALFVIEPVNRLYLTGLRTTNGILLVLPGDEAVFFTDFRYLEMARKTVGSARVRPLASVPDQFEPMARRLKWRKAGFEGAISALQLRSLREAMPTVKTWVESGEPIADLRARKSPAEQQAIRRAVALGDEVFRRTLAEIRPGLAEWDVRRVLRGWVDALDADRESFDCIISAGANASKPHAKVTRRIWRKGQPLLIDMGVRLDQYCSDMTRVVFAGRPSPTIGKIYDVVLTAQLKAIEAVRAGRTGREVDAAARRYIEKRGYGKCFGHGLGHGLGLEIRESPILNPLSRDVLRPGMVMTIEPGVYLPGVGGVRIEDVVIVRSDGCDVLTRTTKERIVVEG
jgi:Xaa-Pro aminopeptidase